MDNKISLTPRRGKGAEMLLNTLAFIARKNASVLCKGLMYEPKIPEKLKK